MRQSFDGDPTPTAVVDVEVSDVFGQQSLEFESLDAATPIADVLGESRSRLALAPEVEWQVQDARTARLLRREQTLGDVAREGKVELKMLPDARLG